MNAQEFIQAYPEILAEIEEVVCDECNRELERMKTVIKPEDLIRPDTIFASRDQAVGFLYFQIMLRAHTNQKITYETDR